MTNAEHRPLITVAQAKIGGISVQAVDARDLHEALGVKRDFTNWVKQQVTRLRLIADRDYLLAQKGEQVASGVKWIAVYTLALDAAKHVAMMANTERGFEVREYFIDCERRAQGEPARVARVDPPAEGPKPFDEWTLEEIRTYLAVANVYRHTLNNASAAWVLMRQGFPRPPRRLLPGWLQSEMELDEPGRAAGVTITVPYTGGRH